MFFLPLVTEASNRVLSSSGNCLRSLTPAPDCHQVAAVTVKAILGVDLLARSDILCLGTNARSSSATISIAAAKFQIIGTGPSTTAPTNAPHP